MHLGPVSPTPKFRTHFDIELNYVIDGQIRYFLGKGEFLVPERRVCAFWAATPHRVIETSQQSRCATFRVPLEYFLQWNLSPTILDAVLDGGVILEPAPMTRPEKVEQWSREFLSEITALRRATLLEMQAALLRCAPFPMQRRTANANPPSASADVEPVLTMCRHISTNLNQSLSSAEVAAVIGLHPTVALRVFKKITGMTIQEYIVQQRMTTAQRYLLTSDLSIEEVGDMAGFQSTSQYYAIFRKVTGFSPLQFRKQKKAL